MTRKQFEEYCGNKSFDYAMDRLYEESNFLRTYDYLKEFAIHLLDEDNVCFALHILNAIYNSKGESDWFYYDVTAGTLCTPICLNTADDVEQYIGFDEEE